MRRERIGTRERTSSGEKMILIISRQIINNNMDERRRKRKKKEGARRVRERALRKVVGVARGRIIRQV